MQVSDVEGNKVIDKNVFWAFQGMTSGSKTGLFGASLIAKFVQKGKKPDT